MKAIANYLDTGIRAWILALPFSESRWFQRSHLPSLSLSFFSGEAVLQNSCVSRFDVRVRIQTIYTRVSVAPALITAITVIATATATNTTTAILSSIHSKPRSCREKCCHYLYLINFYQVSKSKGKLEPRPTASLIIYTDQNLEALLPPVSHPSGPVFWSPCPLRTLLLSQEAPAQSDYLLDHKPYTLRRRLLACTCKCTDVAHCWLINAPFLFPMYVCVFP